MKKIGFLITARLKSSRLPKKLVRDIEGKKLFEHVVDRIKEISEIDTIVLCTSINPQDRELVEISRKENIYYFNGDEEDVVRRLADAAHFYDLDYLVGITGENPLFSIEHTREIIDKVNKNDYDFISPKGLPIGCATYAVKVKALKTVCRIKNILDTEIWGYLINRPEVFNVDIFDVEPAYQWPDLRITIDYDEDLEFVKTIFRKLNYEQRLDLKFVLDYLKQHPEITDIHKDNIQLDVTDEVKQKINSLFTDSLEEILKIKKEIYENDI